MLKRLQWLRHAIIALHSADKIECNVLSSKQWQILHQIEITLQTMAGFQRILEGECYVTGFMLVLAVFQIRQAYISVSSNMNTLPAEKYLTEILLASFNNCYEPADNNGRVRYTGSPDLGFGNRYTGEHP